MTWDGLRGDGVRLSSSPGESNRFGVDIARVVVGVDTTDGAAAAADLTRILRQAKEEVLIVRWPSVMVGLGAAAVASGREIIAADVLTYWDVLPEDLNPGPSQDPRLDIVHVVRPDTATRAMVGGIVSSSFLDYANHYAANPLLDPGRALDGYVEWAESCLSDPRTDVLVLTCDGEPIGIATLQAGSKGDLEILLCGLTSEAQGHGHYQQLLHGVAQFALTRERRRIIISTQAHNVRAQRVWARAGLRPFAAVTTVHALRARRSTG